MEVLDSCRCCLQAGSDLDLTTPYTHLGKTEIYSNMLRDCFDLHVSLAGHGPCGICFTCVSRLRDASNFKLQVQHSQAELQARLRGVNFEYEKVSIKVETEYDNSEEEVVSHVEAVIMKSENIGEDYTPENVCVSTLVKSECSDGDQTLNDERMSSGPVPLDSPSGAEADPVPTSHYEPNPSGHESNESDASDDLAEEFSSDISGEHDTVLKRYPCKLCDKDFVNKSALKRHQRVIHATEKMYVCEYCNKKFTTKDYLDKHKNTHTEASFTCDVCDTIYKKKSDLNLHKAIHIGQKLYECEKCNKSFARVWHLHQHQKNICKQKRYVCEVCDKKFAKKMVLKRHLTIHSGLLPYQCSECDKRFTRIDLLNAHKIIHSSEKAYSCEECEKKFFIKRNYLRHKKTHLGQKYECTVCKKKFNRADSLKAHQRIHTEGKPAKKLKYTCKDCDKQFLSKTDLSRHTRIHTGEKPFACEACHKQFNQKAHLVTHLKSCNKNLGVV